MGRSGLIILIVVYVFTSFPGVNAQDSLLYQRITISDTTCTLEAATSIIEKHTGYSFTYNAGLINKDEIVRVHADNEPLIDVLKTVFDDPSLNFSIIERHLIIYRESKAQTIDQLNTRDSVSYFEIKGRVFDNTDNKPVPFTSIYLFGKPVGNISNEEGEFTLKLGKEYLEDTLIISCVGYYPFKAVVSSLVNTDKNYFLNPNVISIQEVIIRKISPYQILNSAVSSISDNYFTDPSVLTSFYREMVIKGNRHLMVAEAIIETYKPGYSRAFVNDRIKILKGRQSENISTSDTLMLRLKAGLGTLILLDLVDQLPDFITGRSNDQYDYQLVDIVVDDDADHYAIAFKPSENSTTAIFTGRILVSVKDLAYKRIEFNVDPEKLDLATDMYIIKKPSFIKAMLLDATYQIGYRKSGNRYNLYTIQCETKYRIKKRQQLLRSIYTSRLEMVVTGVDTTYTDKFSSRESARLNDFFSDQLGDYDEEFWGAYNYITPDRSLENAIVKLAKSEARMELKE